MAGLSEHILGTDEKEVLDRSKYLVSNPEYHPVVFTSDLPKSRFWEDAAGFSGTVFGDVLEEVSKEHFVLEPAGENAVHIAVKNNAERSRQYRTALRCIIKKSRRTDRLFCGQKP